MLLFRREKELEDSLAQETANRSNGQTVRAAQSWAKPSDWPVDEPQEQEYLTVASQGKNVRRSTWLLAALFGIGLLCLWFMIKKSTAQTAAASRRAGINSEEAQIEIAITQLTGVRSEMFSRMDEILKKFYEFSDVQQVKVNELVKNPFKHEIFMAKVKKNSDTEEGDLLLDPDVTRQQKINQQAKELPLLSIMQSGQSACCMIGDKILYKGDSIEGFKVVEISDSFVKLESEGVEIILKLSE